MTNFGLFLCFGGTSSKTKSTGMGDVSRILKVAYVFPLHSSSALVFSKFPLKKRKVLEIILIAPSEKS